VARAWRVTPRGAESAAQRWRQYVRSPENSARSDDRRVVLDVVLVEVRVEDPQMLVGGSTLEVATWPEARFARRSRALTAVPSACRCCST